MKFRNLLITAFAAMAFSATAFSAEHAIDSAHSNIGFKVKHLLTNATGNFNEFEGTIAFDDAKPESFNGKMKIKAESINTNNKKRDEHLRSADFFDVEKYPTIEFVTKSAKKAGGKKLKVTGDLTMHGVTKPVTLDVEYLGKMTNPMGKTARSFAATGKVNRKDFGIVWNKNLDGGGFVLGEDVNFDIQLEANETGEAAAPAKHK